MARCRLIVAILGVVLPAAAHAQSGSQGFTGFATVSLGGVHAGDVRDGGLALNVSTAIVESSGWGVELDLGHSGAFDGARFVESSLTTLVLNAMGMWRDPTALIRPYAVGGVGLLRSQVCISDCQVSLSRTDWGFDGGAGVFVVFNEIVGVRGDVRYFRFREIHIDVPLTTGDFFSFWRTSVGVTVSWPIR